VSAIVPAPVPPVALSVSHAEARLAGSTDAVQAGAPGLKLTAMEAEPPGAGMTAAEGETENAEGALAAAA
jgi:hypothetical protein